MSEAAAGSLVEGDADPGLRSVFHSASVVVNQVQEVVKFLFDKYGERSIENVPYQFSVNTPRSGRPSYEYDEDYKKRTLWYLSYPSNSPGAFVAIPEQDYLEETLRWPSDYSFYYRRCPKKVFIDCTILWKPISEATFGYLFLNYPPFQKYPEFIKSRQRYYSLMQHVTASGWPEDFVMLASEGSNCEHCDWILFRLYHRELFLDVAFLKNSADKAISFDGLLGIVKNELTLRKQNPQTTSTVGTRGAIPFHRMDLRPGDEVAIPLRISFISRDLSKIPIADARTTFGEIQATAPGTIFREEVKGGKSVMKVRESFGPPTQPVLAVYTYGPEIVVSGLRINEQDVELRPSPPNLMHLTAEEMIGSCPTLYAWDESLTTWVKYGKMIPEANSKEKETTETREFPGFVSLFRLSEEELETAYISRIHLTIELTGGVKFNLLPNQAVVTEAKGHHTIILPGESFRFSFDLPPAVSPEKVAKSTLEISGYYVSL